MSPRVTEVLDSYTEPGLIEWKLRVGKTKAEKISQEALLIGTEVDAAIQADVRGQGYKVEGRRKEVVNCLRAWEAFKAKFPAYLADIEAIQIELTQNNLVGHPDIVHRLEITDIKTGNSLTLRPKYCVQASKYALMKGKDRAAILLLSKTSEVGHYLYIYWEKAMVEYFGGKVFDAFMTLYEYEEIVEEMVIKHLEAEALNVL